MNTHLSHNHWTQKYLLALCSTAILLVVIAAGPFLGQQIYTSTELAYSRIETGF